nr:hypothetical protein CFP56_11074 [Quercus suber]
MHLRRHSAGLHLRDVCTAGRLQHFDACVTPLLFRRLPVAEAYVCSAQGLASRQLGEVVLIGHYAVSPPHRKTWR